MIYKINYILKGKQNYFTVEGDLENLRKEIYEKLKNLGVDCNHNEFWSEEIN